MTLNDAAMQESAARHEKRLSLSEVVVLLLVAALLGLVIFAPAHYSSELTSDSKSLRQVFHSYSQHVSAYPELYWATGIFFTILLWLQMVGAFVQDVYPKAQRVFSWITGRSVFLLVLTLCFLSWRWPVFGLLEQNPDESQAIAGALKLLEHPAFWVTVDGTTHGPLLYYPLTAVGWINLMPDYATARVLGSACIIGMLISTYLALATLFRDSVARLAIVPATVGLGLLTESEFIHYSSEHIPLLLLSISLWMLSRLWCGVGTRANALVLGLATGAMPFAKLQAVPIAGLIALVGLYSSRASKNDNCEPGSSSQHFLLRNIVIGGLLPSLLAALFYTCNSAWFDFYQSYILNNVAYTGRTSGSLLDRLLGLFSMLSHTREMQTLLYSWLSLGVLLLLSLYFFPRKVLRNRWRELFFLCLLSAASVFSVIAPGNHFFHYIWLLSIPAMLFLGISVALFETALGSLPSWRSRAVLSFLSVVAVPLALIAAIFVLRHDYSHIALRRTKSGVPNDPSQLLRTIVKHGRPSESMAIWGWAPRLYVMTGLIPATRDPHAQRQVEHGPQREYYRQRFLRDMLAANPPVFVDAVGAGQFGYSDRGFLGHETFPSLAVHISANYQLVRDIDGARVYVSKQRISDLSSPSVLS